MGLKENIDAGEDAVAEVKRQVQYASSNFAGDRLAALLDDHGTWFERSEEAMQMRKSKELEDPNSWKRVKANVQNKVAFFEQAAKLPAQPAKEAVPPKFDVFRYPTTLDQGINQIRNVYDDKGNLISEGDTKRAYDIFVNAWKYPADFHTRMLAMEIAAKKHKVGNCMEQAAIAFLYLEGSTTAPLDFMAFSNPSKVQDKPLYDHALVVIGRVDGSDPRRVETWGSEAIWCDPWQLRTGRVYSIDDLIKKKATNLDSAFKLNTAELVNAGWPKVHWRRA